MSRLFWFLSLSRWTPCTKYKQNSRPTCKYQNVLHGDPEWRPVTNPNDILTNINMRNSTIPLIDYFTVQNLVYHLSSTSFESFSEFWICTSTEAQNQPHFSGIDVLLFPDPCGSFALSFIRIGWKEYYFFIPIVYPIVDCDFFCVDLKYYLFLLDNTVRTAHVIYILS